MALLILSAKDDEGIATRTCCMVDSWRRDVPFVAYSWIARILALTLDLVTSWNSDRMDIVVT